MDTASPQASRSRTARGGFVWTTLSVAVHGGLQIPVLAVLARHVSPEEFGMANAALLVIGLGLNVFEGGVALNVAQRKRLDRRDEATAFQVSVTLSLIVLGVVSAASGLIAGFFSRPQIASAITVVAWSFLLSGLTAVSESLLYNRGAYRTAAVVMIVSYVVGYAAVAVVLAVAGYGYWSLIYAQITMKLVKLVMLAVCARHAILVRPDLATWREHLTQTLAFSVGRVATFFADQGDLIVVGRMLGVEALGFYGRAHQLMMVPNKVFLKIAIRVTTPLFASIQDDVPRVGNALCRSVRMTNQVMAPVIVFLVLFRREVVGLLLGPDWSAVGDLLAILAIAGYFHVIYKVPLSVMHSQRLAGNSAISQSIFGTALVLAVIAATRYGLPAVAAAVALVTATNYVFISGQIVMRLRVKGITYVAAHLPGAIAGVVVLAMAVVLRYGLDGRVADVVIAAAGALIAAGAAAVPLRGFVRWPLRRSPS